jgi:tetratricopeptide (TPR) repeat protein
MERALEEVKRIERSGPLWQYGEAVRLCVLAKAQNRPELYSKAKEHLTEARIARPAWSRVPHLAAQIYDEQGDEDSAIYNYTRAINLGERDIAIVSRAVRLLYQRQRFSEADRLIRHQQEQQQPFSSELIRLATDISLRLNDAERALSLVTRTAEKSKDPVDHIFTGRVLDALGRHEEAEKRLWGAIALDESAPAAWVAVIQHFARTKQTEPLEAALKEAEQRIAPSEALLAIAEALESIGRMKEAESRIKVALDAAPDNLTLIRRLADLYLRERKYSEAEPLFNRMLKDEVRVTGTERMHSRRSLALALLAHGDQASRKNALTLIAENLAVDPRSEDDQRSRAMILALFPDRASRLEAAQLLEKLLGDRRSDEDAESLFVLASLYVDLGDGAKAARHLRTLMVRKGDDLGYLTYYVQFLISQKEIGEAQLWQNRLERLFPLEINTLALAIDIAFAREQFDDIVRFVDSYLLRVQENDTKRNERRRLTASILEASADRLKKMAAQNPEALVTLEGWISRFLGRAEALYRDEAISLPRDSLAQAAFYGRIGRHTESLDLLESNSSDAKPEEIAAVTVTLLKSPAAAKQHFARAAQVVEAALHQGNRPLALVLALADLHNFGEKFGDAERLYREALDEDPHNVGALNNLALLLALRRRGGQEPLSLIQRAMDITGSTPGLLDSRATIHLLSGDLRHAADDLRMAQLRHPSAGSYFRQAQIEFRSGDRVAARASLAKARKLGLKSEELHPLERPAFRQMQAEFR